LSPAVDARGAALAIWAALLAYTNAAAEPPRNARRPCGLLPPWPTPTRPLRCPGKGRHVFPLRTARKESAERAARRTAARRRSETTATGSWAGRVAGTARPKTRSRLPRTARPPPRATWPASFSLLSALESGIAEERRAKFVKSKLRDIWTHLHGPNVERKAPSIRSDAICITICCLGLNALLCQGGEGHCSANS
jgi:hypothetical protein